MTKHLACVNMWTVVVLRAQGRPVPIDRPPVFRERLLDSVDRSALSERHVRGSQMEEAPALLAAEDVGKRDSFQM